MKNSFFSFLGSAKLAIFLFFLLAVLSIFGTIIPQGQPLEFYLTKYGQSFGKLIQFFQLYDAYHSPWYVASLFLFMVNLTVCSLNRLSFTMKLFRRSPSEVKPENLPGKKELILSLSLAQLLPIVEKKLKFKRAKQDSYLYYRKENNWAHFSVYVVHFSLVIILLGALIGALWGFRGNISILEREESNIVQPLRNKEPIHLDFKVRLNKFILDTYPNGMPKEYISNVTFIDGEKKVDAIIKVNSPVKYKEVTFYQASYDVIPLFKFKFKINNQEYTTDLSRLNPFSLDKGLSIAVSDYGQAHGIIFAKLWLLDEAEQESAEFISLQAPDKFIEGRFPPMLCSGGGQGLVPCEEVEVGRFRVSASLEGISKEIFITGLQAKKDPGVWIVYAGFFLMMVGLFLVYYFEPRIYWIYLKEENDVTAVTLGAYAKRDREGVKAKIKELANILQSA